MAVLFVSHLILILFPYEERFFDAHFKKNTHLISFLTTSGIKSMYSIPMYYNANKQVLKVSSKCKPHSST